MAMCASLLAGGCTHEVRSDATAERARFIASTLQLSASETELGTTAARRASTAEVRALGEQMARDYGRLHQELAALAARKGVLVPAGVDEKRAALKGNLAYLVGPVFENAYSLAMVEDLERLVPSFKAASRSGDADVEAFARRWLPVLEQEQNLAGAALKKTGGSPFGFVPK